MEDKEINTNKYFVELTDIGGGTIGYTVPFPEELLREIIKQNKQLKRKEQECEELKREVDYSHDQNRRWSKAWLKIWRQRTRYSKALKEIEEIVYELCIVNDQEDYKLCDVWREHKDILDIINKVKGEG